MQTFNKGLISLYRNLWFKRRKHKVTFTLDTAIPFLKLTSRHAQS